MLTDSEFADELVRHRRALHRLAEASGEEYRTQTYLCESLRGIGLKPRRIGTGVLCEYRAGCKAKRLAFRADMDALPIPEETGREFASEDTSYSHACGHDGHMAILLTLAHKVVCVQPCVNVRFLFQPEEELGGGAEKLIAAGALDDVDYVFGTHLAPHLAEGTVATSDGALFAGTCDFKIEFTGKSAHVAQRDKGCDALRAAADCYGALTRVYEERYAETCLFGLCSLHAGTAHNVVADRAELRGTFRYFDDGRKEAFFMDLERELVRITNTLGTEHRFVSLAVYPPLVNSPKLTRYLSERLGIAEVSARWTAEDFAFYLERVHGMYYWLGVGDKYADCLHSPAFDFDESVLYKALEIDFSILRMAERGEI